MSRILTTGIATLDIINSVEHYPAEDEEVRAQAHSINRGGNAANTACVLAQNGHKVEFLGVLAAEPDGEYIRDELLRFNINIANCPVVAGKAPTSYITLNTSNGSRTIVHYRDLPELDSSHFLRLASEAYDWFHFEARNITECYLMLSVCRQRKVDQPISLEVEKERPGIESLFPLADVLLFSRSYVVARGFNNAYDFFEHIKTDCPESILICSWGADGAFAQDPQGKSYFSPAAKVETVLDTIGAGDTFNAGIINALASGSTLEDALNHACLLAGKKVAQNGFDNLYPIIPGSDE